MLVVISPAKRLDWSERSQKMTEPAFAAEAGSLARTARNLPLRDLKSLMSLSDDLARLNRDRFKEFKTEPTADASEPRIGGGSVPLAATRHPAATSPSSPPAASLSAINRDGTQYLVPFDQQGDLVKAWIEDERDGLNRLKERLVAAAGEDELDEREAGGALRVVSRTTSRKSGSSSTTFV